MALNAIGMDMGKTFGQDDSDSSALEEAKKLDKKDFEAIWVKAHYMAAVNPGTRDFIEQHKLYSLEAIDSVAMEAGLYDEMITEDLTSIQAWGLKFGLKAYYYENEIYERLFSNSH